MFGREPRLQMGISVPSKPPVFTLSQAIWASRAIGMDTIFFWDHVQDFVPQAIWTDENTWLARQSRSPHQWFDVWTMSGAVTAKAGRMQIGIGVTEMFRNHPVLLAQRALTLAHFTKKAPIIGIGAGERENTEPIGISFETPVSRLEEGLKILRMTLTSHGTFSHNGEFFQLDHAVMDLPAPRGRMPEVWVGGVGPRMLRLTGEYGDGWYPTGKYTPDEYAEKLTKIHTAARNVGRDPRNIKPSLMSALLLASTKEELDEVVQSRGAQFTALMSSWAEWKAVGATHPFGPEFRGYIDILPERLDPEKLLTDMDSIGPDLVRELIVCGTPDEVIPYYRSLSDAGLRHVAFLPVAGMISQRLMMQNVRGLWKLRRAIR